MLEAVLDTSFQVRDLDLGAGPFADQMPLQARQIGIERRVARGFVVGGQSHLRIKKGGLLLLQADALFTVNPLQVPGGAVLLGHERVLLRQQLF